MIGAAELAQMKPGAYLLNASRGTVVVIDALADGDQAAATSAAPRSTSIPRSPRRTATASRRALRGLPNVILTPHIGGSTEEAQEAIGREVATALIKFVNTGATTGAVNFPQVELPTDAGRAPHPQRAQNVPGVLRDINKIVSDLQREHPRAGARDRPRHRLPRHGPRPGRLAAT